MRVVSSFYSDMVSLYKSSPFYIFGWETVKEPRLMLDIIPEFWMPLFIFIARIGM